MQTHNTHLDALIRLALAEDLGTSGDITSAACIAPTTRAEGFLRAKEPLTLAGTDCISAVFAQVDPTVEIVMHKRDGDVLAVGDVVATLQGNAQSLLIGERPALNFVMRLSGIATLTARMTAAVAGTAARVIDTRKTTPGWRALEKAAVRAGGGGNHRMGLFDGVLIKDNHIEAAGGITAAVARARAAVHHLIRIEVECATLAHVDECLSLGVEAMLLDNMSTARMSDAVKRVRDHARGSGRHTVLEASGNMTLARLPEVAATGVDFISMGALTHQATSCDLSMKIRALS